MIRKATISDINDIMGIIDEARETMRANGNTTQWPVGYPSVETIKNDVATGTGYVMTEGNAAVAYFAFKPSPDPTYLKIYGGEWTDVTSPYYVIHRIACRQSTHGVFSKVMDYCFSRTNNIRIDTHRDNTIMQHLLKKHGFAYCGIIHLLNGEERLAYQKKTCDIRTATIDDLDEISALEAECFPAEEAASRASFEWRLRTYPSHFFVLLKDGKIVSFVNGPVTAQLDLVDEMYDSAEYSSEDADWQMIFGVVTHPDFQHQGWASLLMKNFVEHARNEGRKGVVLTCKTEKIAFYERFGFKDEGLSASVHGGVAWNQMRLTF